jgi:NitT/TauT family transport system substrate-binding protein
MALTLSGCGAGDLSDTSPNPKAPDDKLEKVTIGVGYIPNVQFAPFYVAQTKGYFTQEGLDVTLEYGNETDFIKLVAQGERDFAIGSGDQEILGRAQGLPVKYVMNWYRSFPVGIMALKDKGIDSPAKLEGKIVGTPVLFGASFIGWKALVYAAGLDEKKISLQVVGFNQAEAVQSGTVDAAVVYITNEPLRLEQNGYPVDVLKVSDYINLVSNGLIVNDNLIKSNPELIRRVVRALVKGVTYSAAHPDEAFDICRSKVKEISDADAPTQKKVLLTSIDLWETEKPGVSDPKSWQTSVEFMQKTGLIKEQLDPQQLYTNEFVQP